MGAAKPGRRAKRPHPADLHEAKQIARAVAFSTARFLGRGKYDTARFQTLAEARAAAGACPRTMVYAITPEGWTIPVSAEKRA